MTNLYFVRHAKVVYTEDDLTRPLSVEGKADIHKVTEFFKYIQIDKIVSSPYIRAIHTIHGVAEDKELEIESIHDLRERKVTHGFIDDFESFVLRQWEDFHFKIDGGESLFEVQKRGNEVMKYLLDIHKDKNVLIGTHGTFLAVMLNSYNPKYDFEFWKTIEMPDIFKLQFNGEELVSIRNFKV